MVSFHVCKQINVVLCFNQNLANAPKAAQLGNGLDSQPNT